MKMALWFISLLSGLYLLMLILLYIFQARLVYFPSRHLEATPAVRNLEFEDVTIRTKDHEKIHGWFIPVHDARFTLLFFHGNAGNISHRLESIEQFHTLGLNVLIIDYRGYGKSTGTPSEQGTYLDGFAAWEYLINEKEIPAEEIIIFGRSLGGPIAAKIAMEKDPAGLIIESSFTSLSDLGREIYPYIPVRLLIRIKYPTIEYVRNVKAPIFIGHSASDSLIPFHHGQRLFEAAREPRYWLEMMGDHNVGYLETGEQYMSELNRFFEYLTTERNNNNHDHS